MSPPRLQCRLLSQRNNKPGAQNRVECVPPRSTWIQPPLFTSFNLLMSPGCCQIHSTAQQVFIKTLPECWHSEPKSSVSDVSITLLLTGRMQWTQVTGTHGGGSMPDKCKQTLRERHLEQPATPQATGNKTLDTAACLSPCLRRIHCVSVDNVKTIRS